jgi:hypothetical protein
VALRTRLLVLLLASLGFVGGGIFLLATDAPAAVGWMGIL